MKTIGLDENLEAKRGRENDIGVERNGQLISIETLLQKLIQLHSLDRFRLSSLLSSLLFFLLGFIVFWSCGHFSKFQVLQRDWTISNKLKIHSFSSLSHFSSYTTFFSHPLFLSFFLSFFVSLFQLEQRQKYNFFRWKIIETLGKSRSATRNGQITLIWLVSFFCISLSPSLSLSLSFPIILTFFSSKCSAFFFSF